MTASASWSDASLTIRLNASSRDCEIIWVYDFISPPMTFLNPAAMSRPMCLARIVLPLTIPKICFTFLFGIKSVVVVIISVMLFFRGLCFYIFSLFYFAFFFVEDYHCDAEGHYYYWGY